MSLKLASLPRLRREDDLLQWARELVDVLERVILEIDKTLETKVDKP